MRRKPFAWSICLPVMMAILAFPMGASAQTGSLLSCFPHPTTGGCAAGNGRGVAFDGIDLYYTIVGDDHIYKTDVNGNCLGACSTAGLSAGGPLAYDFGNNTVWTIDYDSNSFTVYEFTWQAAGNCPLVSSCDMSLVSPAHPAITTPSPGNIGFAPDGMHWTAADTLWISEEAVGGNVTVEVDVSLGSCNIVNGYINPLTAGVGTSGLAFDGVDVWHAANGAFQIFQTQVPPTPPPNTLAPTPAKGPNIFPDTAGCEDLEWDTNTFVNQNVCGLWCNTVTGVPQPESLCAFEVPCTECDPDPRTQGYWHRQCLGIPAAEGGIDPGRNGRGPSEPIEPDFQNVLMPAVDVELQNRLFLFGGTCQDGIDADPPSDQCQKAIKQYTALLLNVESGKLQNNCAIDLSAENCASTTIGNLLTELAGQINGGDCNQAAGCASAVNEGTALESLTLPDEVASAPDAPKPATIPVAKARRVGTARGTPQGKDSAAQTVQPSVSSESPLMVWNPGADVDADADTDAAMEPSAPVDDDLVGAIQRHLAVFGNSAAPERARNASTDALLTALSGGFGLEVRIQIVTGLLGKVDVAYESLLAEHLRDIRKEAADFGKEDLAKEAERLLKRLADEKE